MNILPKSLFGRLVLVLLTGLILAQLLSAFILLRDRGQVLYESIRENMIVRTVELIRLLDAIPLQNRQELIPILDSPELNIALLNQPTSSALDTRESDISSVMIKQQLLKRLKMDTDIRVSIKNTFMVRQMSTMHRRHMMDDNHMSGPWLYMHGLHNLARFFHIEVQLTDGSWVSFERSVSDQLFNWPTRLVIVLSVLLFSVIILSLISVRSIIQPLRDLRLAADGLGKDIQQPPLQVTGPSEVKATAKAFNTMQSRLKNYIEDRASILAAVSHDLKTPLTRIRLRTDLMNDEELRTRTQYDLDDMESMLSATLEFMRGTETREPNQRLDLVALLESIQEDALETGENVQFHGSATGAYEGKPLALKRCIVNLVENAVRYGGHTEIRIEDNPEEVVISICDNGPGIPENDLQKVFDPFFRLETSRSINTGGTGLGLGIARNVARAHGGDLILNNRPEGGLCAKLILPR